MTGISLPGQGRMAKEELPSVRYIKAKQVPERYSMIQFGVCLFHHIVPAESEEGEMLPDGDGQETPKEWRCRRYNFYTFPHADSERDVVMSPSSVAFLNRFNMSYDQWVKEGVPASTTEETKSILEEYILKQKADDLIASIQPASPTMQQASRRVELRRPDDIEFFSRCMASLREWLDSPGHAAAAPPPDAELAEGAQFLLPPCNSFLRRAFYEAIGQEYPSLILENAGRDHPNQIRVWRLDEDEKQRREARLRRQGFDKIVVGRAGLQRIFLALSYACRGLVPDRQCVLFAPSIDHVDWDLPAQAHLAQAARRKIPLVVHNGFMDISFMMTHFVSPTLPETLVEFKNTIAAHFPVFYDTKVMATECSPTHHNDNTGLGNLFDRICRVQNLTMRIEMVEPEGAPPDQEHEAAYDAFMTGVCFAGLCHDIGTLTGGGGVNPMAATASTSGIVRRFFGRNKLYTMSLYTIDVEEDSNDPLQSGMLPESTFRVTGIDPAVSTRDIIRVLSPITYDGVRVQYEIIWIDDTTFLVAVSFRQGMLGITGGGPQQQQQQHPPPDLATARQIIRQQGAVVERALGARFISDNVVSLKDHLKKMEESRQQQKEDASPSVLARLAGLFGFGKRKSTEEEADSPQTKRRRLH